MIVRRFAAGVAATTLLIAACGGSESDTTDTADADPTSEEPVAGAQQNDGERLPDVALVPLVPLAGGDATSLADIDGPAVVNLWATWCAPCRAEIPDFEEVHQQRGDEVRFVGINIGEDGDRAQAFIDEVGATYDQFLDPEGFVVTELQTTAMPVTLVLDPTGAVSLRHLGPMDQDDLNEAIDEAIG